MGDSSNVTTSKISLLDKVLLVGATPNVALRDYETYSAYMCKGGRYAQPSNYLAFYHSGKIDRRVPKILGYIKRVVLNDYTHGDQTPYIIMAGADIDELNALFFKLIEKMKAHDDPRLEDSLKIIFLSDEDDKRTQLLNKEIVNDKLSKSGKVTRFVQSQRYVSLARLRTAHSTSELEQV